MGGRRASGAGLRPTVEFAAVGVARRRGESLILEIRRDERMRYREMVRDREDVWGPTMFRVS